MRCDEVQPLQGVYMDSELDARTSLEIEQHLKGCQECWRIFMQAQQFEHWLKAGLNRSQPSSFCWEKTAEAVRAVLAPLGPNGAPQVSFFRGKPAISSLAARLRAAWKQSPWTWTALAAAWMAILCLNTAAKESSTPVLARQRAPSTSELRFALKQRERLMADLTFFVTDQSVPNKTKASSPGPRSERRPKTLNT
jgi:anti-sigma factor RsiW